MSSKNSQTTGDFRRIHPREPSLGQWISDLPCCCPSFDGYRLCPGIKAGFHQQNNPLPLHSSRCAHSWACLRFCWLFLPLPAAVAHELKSPGVPERPEELLVWPSTQGKQGLLTMSQKKSLRTNQFEKLNFIEKRFSLDWSTALIEQDA